MKNLIKTSFIPLLRTSLRRFSRHYSGSIIEQNQFYSCETIQSNGYHILNLALCHKPVNVLSINFMERMTVLMLDIKKGVYPVDAMIIRSSIPGIFSSGLDLRYQLVDKDSNLDRIYKYYTVFHSFWQSLYCLELPVVSVIDGTCLAAGCAIALATDYRIMCDGPYKIGIIATKVGLSTPIWFRKMLSNVIGHTRAERALQTSRLFSPKEALSINFIDDIISSEDSQAAALSVLEEFLCVDSQARGITKLNFRNQVIHDSEENLSSDRDEFVKILSYNSTQRCISEILNKLKN